MPLTFLDINFLFSRQAMVAEVEFFLLPRKPRGEGIVESKETHR